MKKNRKNFLISSTRQWNCGDEFIWIGIKKMFNQLGTNDNYLLYNRHPMINTNSRFVRGVLGFPKRDDWMDNSYNISNITRVHLVIFAGTPDWMGIKNHLLHKYILKNDIPCIFLGVGLNKAKPYISKTLSCLLRRKNTLFIARDEQAYKLASQYGAAFLYPCPAFFSTSSIITPNKDSQIRKIAIVLQGQSQKWTNISREYINSVVRLSGSLRQMKYQLFYIAHYHDDLNLYYTMENYLQGDVYYSFDAVDYERIYSQADLTLGTRVHGAAISASLGIPAFLVPTDLRASAAKLFGAYIVDDLNSVQKEIQRVNRRNYADNISRIKIDYFSQYLDTLQSFLASCGLSNSMDVCD